MNTNKSQTATAGIALIVLGVVWWLNLWSLIVPAALIAGGVFGYIQRKRMGRPVEAVQAGLWAVGLGILLLLGFLWPGILFLAGASILLRGHEIEADNRLQQSLNSTRRARPQQPVTVQQVPIITQQTNEPSVTGETTRL